MDNRSALSPLTRSKLPTRHRLMSVGSRQSQWTPPCSKNSSITSLSRELHPQEQQSSRENWTIIACLRFTVPSHLPVASLCFFFSFPQ
ncbi:hypothetical protein FA10DRAFT_241251 [Acaromyces ingoldii]|uniref:Uncharacterized protein n=1 Tax=Acaromyces ingoldii TaxID=215250 RepID=A0A316YLN8_9BASI|nr:hypothetical protein FA10DRAFT_241251 [Acaromyces ingoldii]PWN90470.1 hypothetical protein FA10DRAFT_241251 [Acaromyces ingoldii]